MSDFISDLEEIHKEVKVCYRREFLLSLSKLDSCKKLSTEFDSSISRELSDTCAGSLHTCDSETSCPERKLQQPMRQNPENGLLGKGSFPREGGGKIGASPSEAQTMRQNTENGILGEGFFPNEAECIVGVSSTEVQSCGFHLLSRSATPYRPPHLSKVNLLSQMEIRGINDGNSFGSTDFSSMEKVDEERRIRDSLELMTKGEQAFQEVHEQREDLDSGITSLLGDFANNFEKYSQPENFVTSSTPALTAVISVPGNRVNLEDTFGQDLDEISHGVDEICLPDEDSLITVEDFIVPKDLLLIPDRAWSSTKIGPFFPATPAEIFRKLPVLNPSTDDRKSKPSRVTTYVDWNAGQLNPHFYQPHANPVGNLFLSQSQTAAGRSEVESMNTKFSFHLAPDLAFSTTQSGAWQNFYDPFVHPSQRQIQPPAGFLSTHRTAPSQTKNSRLSFSQSNFWRL